MDSEIACRLVLFTETFSFGDGKLFFVEMKDNLFEIQILYIGSGTERKLSSQNIDLSGLASCIHLNCGDGYLQIMSRQI